MPNKKASSPRDVKKQMAEHGLHFTKSLGQNFLTDQNILKKIADYPVLTKEDAVLEIGPGLGALTEELLERAGYVLSVEIDQTFLPLLEERFSAFPNFHLLQGDALQVDLSGFPEGFSYRKKCLVANVPYYITSPLLARFLDDAFFFDQVTVLVQKELAERLVAQPGNKAYGAFSLLAKLYGEAELAFVVPRTVFLPMPQVDSALVQLTRKDRGLRSAEKKELNALIRRLFQQRRKVLAKTLAQARGSERAQIQEALTKLGHSAQARPEELSLEDYLGLFAALGYIEKR